MALQSSTGYVRLSISTGFDETTLTVNWLTFDTTDWRESNPKRVFSGVVESGSHTFDLAIKETQSVPIENPEKGGPTHEDVEVIIGYLPQTMDQAYLLIQNLSVKEADFASVKFSNTEQSEGEPVKEIYPFWQPDMKMLAGKVVRFYDGEEWKDYEVLQDHASEVGLEPSKATDFFKIAERKA